MIPWITGACRVKSLCPGIHTLLIVQFNMRLQEETILGNAKRHTCTAHASLGLWTHFDSLTCTVSYGEVHFSCPLPHLYEDNPSGLWEHVENQSFLILPHHLWRS